MKRQIFKDIEQAFMYILAISIAAGLFILIGLLIYRSIPPENKDLLNIVIGAFLAAFSSIITYFFGSSKGSSEKTEHIMKLTNGKKVEENNNAVG